MRSIRKYILSSVNTTGYVLTQSVNGRWFIFMGTMVAEFITIITRRIHALYANWDGGFTHYFRKNNDIQWRFSNKHMIVYRDPAEKCEEYIVYTVSELYKILFELRKDM